MYIKVIIITYVKIGNNKPPDRKKFPKHGEKVRFFL